MSVRSIGSRVLNAPARICICSPRTTNTIKLVVYEEVVEIELIFQTIGHRDARWARANDNGIDFLRVCRHVEKGAGSPSDN